MLFISGSTYLNENPGTCERYARSAGFLAGWQPVIQHLGGASQGGLVRLSGLRFEGLGEASGGGTQNASSGVPVLALYRLDNEQLTWAGAHPGAAFSPTSLTSAALVGVPQGPAFAILFANGIPSEAAYVSVQPYLAFMPVVNR